MNSRLQGIREQIKQSHYINNGKQNEQHHRKNYIYNNKLF